LLKNNGLVAQLVRAQS